MVESFVIDVSIIIIAATALAILAKTLKQPLIPAYVIAGVIIGPLGLKFITDAELISQLAEFGIALLLFVVGLELSFRRLKIVGKVASIGGIVQVLATAGIGYIIAITLGFNSIEAIYIGLILAFSSTIVVIKLLSDKNELDTLHGRIMLGILLVQDVLVILALSFLINLGNLSVIIIGVTMLKAVGLLIVALVIARYILPIFFKKIAESQELLFMFAISWCFVFAGIAYYIGFSIAIGAFLAGVGLATFPYNLEIIGRVKPLRDFFLTIFFVSIGMQITAKLSMSLITPIVILIIAAMLLKPLIIMLISSAFKYSQRTAFLSGIDMGQISEFSIILVAQGFILKQVSQELLSITIIVAVVTMLLSSYIIKYDDKLYKSVAGSLAFLSKGKIGEKIKPADKFNGHVILFGAHRMGFSIIDVLKNLNKTYVIIDYNPDIIENLRNQDIPCIYGDIGDIEILRRAGINKASIVISTIPSHEDNLVMVETLNELNKDAISIVISNSIDQAIELYDAGASYVILPKQISGEKIVDILKHFSDKKIINTLKIRQLKLLEKTKEREILERFAPIFLKHKKLMEKLRIRKHK